MRPRSNAEASAASARSATWRTSRPITQGRHLRTHRKSGGGELKQRCEAKAATRPPAQRGEGLGRGASIADRLIPAEALGSEAHTCERKGCTLRGQAACRWSAACVKCGALAESRPASIPRAYLLGAAASARVSPLKPHARLSAHGLLNQRPVAHCQHTQKECTGAVVGSIVRQPRCMFGAPRR